MNRPKQKVVQVEDVTVRAEDVQGRVHDVTLWRAHLQCGHYVDLSPRKRVRPPKAWRCALCQTQKQAVAT